MFGYYNEIEDIDFKQTFESIRITNESILKINILENDIK